MNSAQAAYRRALSASVVEHARYLAAQGDKALTPHLIERRLDAWQLMEARKIRLHARLKAKIGP